ncbi:DUF397 domain-containing protein [Streptomyces sp. MNU76]|uniref:DUF397 domain-containing protein n=1 Tax=Streptomyces sp. MNU76 TaxID=2560026 RepID=UPI001E3955BE|nr:DUF397 domain-containing protein [Streptomyces sp. MNU76]MCC9706684.1 DUF397 domain-containing protein [Streptomyces sp. MNU76]
MANVPWRKSGYSGHTGGDCVEVAHLTPHTSPSATPRPRVGTLALSPEAYVAFVGHVGR